MVTKKQIPVGIIPTTTRQMRPSQFFSKYIDLLSSDSPKIVENVDFQKNTFDSSSVVAESQPLFEVSPSILVFQDFRAFDIQEKKIYFRNNDLVTMESLQFI
jgi:hypothetical protein